jgi:hypothetical protein
MLLTAGFSACSEEVAVPDSVADGGDADTDSDTDSDGDSDGDYGLCSGGWSAPQRLDQGDLMVWWPRVVVDNNGFVTAAWNENYDAIRSRRSIGGTVWEPVDTVAENLDNGVELAADGLGDVYAAWFYTEDGDSDVMTSIHVSSGGWETPAALEPPGTSYANDLVIGSSHLGYSATAWEANSGGTLTAAVHSPGSGWSAKTLLDPDADQPALTMDSQGRAMIVARVMLTLADPDELWAYRYDPDTGWDTGTQIGQVTADTHPDTPIVVSNADGDVLAGWTEWGALLDSKIWIARYEEGSGWSPAEELAVGDVDLVALAADAGGNDIAVWREREELSADSWEDRLLAAQAAGSEWGDPEDLVSVTDRNVGNEALLGIAATGMRVLVWRMEDESAATFDIHHLWSTCYDPEYGWTPPERLNELPTTVHFSYDVALNGSGLAAVVFTQAETGGLDVNERVWVVVRD